MWTVPNYNNLFIIKCLHVKTQPFRLQVWQPVLPVFVKNGNNDGYIWLLSLDSIGSAPFDSIKFTCQFEHSVMEDFHHQFNWRIPFFKQSAPTPRAFHSTKWRPSLNQLNFKWFYKNILWSIELMESATLAFNYLIIKKYFHKGPSDRLKWNQMRTCLNLNWW